MELPSDILAYMSEHAFTYSQDTLLGLLHVFKPINHPNQYMFIRYIDAVNGIWKLGWSLRNGMGLKLCNTVPELLEQIGNIVYESEREPIPPHPFYNKE